MARPRQFDEGTVLQAAADVFWTKGYEATSTRDLTESTGLTQSSIYAAFGDKRGIFLSALEHYLNRSLRQRIDYLEASVSPGWAITTFFNDVIEGSLADSRHRGCLLVNTALEANADDPGLQRIVANETIAIEQFFQRSVAAAQKSGEISVNGTVADVARHLLGVVLGLRVLVRVRPEAELLFGVVRPALAALGLSWSADTGSPRVRRAKPKGARS